ncbi:alkylhydroperoxidase AhpD family core domain-containing protein [Modestobacter sp. DSM 44400]|uniref:carboxymuconolactone decarboxylase family protein n=1 Tax=Modestobacter sp. DSM 44400 TaxID=1550230 RepID=UPI0008987C81|nr:carboxymuconolactone decarboxylase family protein [Modestobacter sp. DSM 44400]SDY28106.1 alkylhydroperoxidase AhpD family core domain-containing protein [Modestobacter sp. DSM 44400]
MTGSGARLPDPPEDGDPATAAAAAVLRARRRGELSGLDRMLLYSPPVAEGWSALLGALRNRTTLTPDLTELAVLRISVLNDAPFEWTSHEPAARRAGVTDEQLVALRTLDATEAPVFSPVQALALRFTDASSRAIAVPDALFAELREHLDDRQVVELAAIVAGYAMVSRFLVALRVPPGDGEVSG